MARLVDRLNPLKVKALKEPGLHADGKGLFLSVSETGAKSWRLILSIRGKRCELGLGSATVVSLSEARTKRDEALKLRHQGLDPREVWGRKPNSSEPVTFGSVALDFITDHEPTWKNRKHRKQWRSTLETYAASIWDKPVGEVDVEDVLNILRPIWSSKAETASRVRGRIEQVLNAAKVRKLRSGENPAAWKGNLDHLLPRQKRGPKRHHPAMPYEAAPAFVARLAELDGASAFALRFTVLTAARTGETIGATWKEIDLAAALWTIPGSRMKAGKEHRVPLNGAAVELLKGLQSDRRPNDYVFNSGNPERHLSGMAMAMVLRRMELGQFTVHGFRSTFRDWAGDRTDFPREIVEQALAHAVGNEVERAYRRGDALEKRRELMEAWAEFLLTNCHVENSDLALGRELVA